MSIGLKGCDCLSESDDAAGRARSSAKSVPVHALMLPAIRADVLFPHLAEECRSNSYLFQHDARFQAQVSNQFVDRRDLHVVQHHPAAFLDCGNR